MIRAAMVLAIVAPLSAPAHASSSCLDKNEAARTWPGRVLAIDDDGCWTYFRRGLKPAPVDDSVNDRPAKGQPTVPPNVRKWANTMAAISEIDPTAQTALWVDRWPDVIVVPPKPVFVEPPQPLMRTILVVAAIVALSVSLVTVVFGGMIERRKPETRDGYFT
jgi:hypothetical protein